MKNSIRLYTAWLAAGWAILVMLCWIFRNPLSYPCVAITFGAIAALNFLGGSHA